MPRSSPQPDSAAVPLPRVDDVVPAAALPLGEVELRGVYLGPHNFRLPAVYVDGDAAHILMSRPYAAGLSRSRRSLHGTD